MSIISFNQLDATTSDGRYTQKDLIKRIRRIASTHGCDGVADSVINSFVMNGIIEIYNELGYQKWVDLIHQMVNHEVAERSI